MNQFHLGNSSFNFRFKILHFWTIHQIEYDLSLILCLSRIVFIQTIEDCVLGGQDTPYQSDHDLFLLFLF